MNLRRNSINDVLVYFRYAQMSANMNETFMVRTSIPEILTDDNEILNNDMQTNLTQISLKTKLHDEHNRTSSMELVTLPKTLDNNVVNYKFFRINKSYH